MLLEHERNYGLGMDAAGPRMLLEQAQNYGLGLDALVTVCSRNTNGTMVWAWMMRGPGDGQNGRTASEACRGATFS